VRPKVPVKPFAKAPSKPRRPNPTRIGIRPMVLYGGFSALMLTNALTLVGLLMAPDIGKLFASQNGSVFSAYEDRIAQLRLEVDRLQSRHYAQTGDINLQLQELAQTQEVLVEQHQYVKELADKAAALGITDASLSRNASGGGAPAIPAAGSTDGDSPAAPEGATDGDSGPAARVAAATASVNKMMDESKLALATLSDEASARTNQIMGTLATIGIKPKLPDAEADTEAEGGPLLPPVDGAEGTSLIDDANAVAAALERLKSAKEAANGAPIHMPVSSTARVSSIFGNRKDPFTGRLAFHPGIDFAAPWGTTVLSAGAGLWSVFFLVPTGRGSRLRPLSAVEEEDVLHWLYDVSELVAVKATEAPHYRRIAIQRTQQPKPPCGELGARLRDATSDLLAGQVSTRPRRPPIDVNSGRGFAFIDHRGEVYPSGFLPVTVGSVRTAPFADIYRDAPLLRALRDPDALGGKCGRCEFRDVCGGSRSRAYAATGDPLAEDPSCPYQAAVGVITSR